MLFIIKNQPNSNSLENLHLIIAMSNIINNIQVLFLEQGIKHICTNQQNVDDDLLKQYSVLPEFGVNKLYIDNKNTNYSDYDFTLPVDSVDIKQLITPQAHVICL